MLRTFAESCSDPVRYIHDVCFSTDRGSASAEDELTERRLLMNDSLFDEDFSRSDIPVFLKLASPTLCSVRWSSAFLCALGDKWGLESFSPSTEVSMTSLTIWYLSRSTSSVVGSGENGSLLSVRQFWDEWHDKGVNFGAFRSIIAPFTPKSVCYLDRFIIC